MSDVNFQPVFDYIDQAKNEIKEDILTEVKAELGDVKTSIANLSSQVQKYHEEMLVSGHRIDRLEDWAKVVGEKVGVPISF